MNNQFATRLKQAMDLRGIKASELSEKAKIPKSAISQYLSGLYEAKQKSIFKLANVLDVSEVCFKSRTDDFKLCISFNK